MSDRSWMLNRSAIASAKACIEIVKEELDIQLKLSHPDFIEMIAEYCELTDSKQLMQAYLALLSFAEPDKLGKTVSVLPQINRNNRSPNNTASEAKVMDSPPVDSDEHIQYHGKDYLRYDASGREFQGLYRGAARYG